MERLAKQLIHSGFPFFLQLLGIGGDRSNSARIPNGPVDPDEMLEYCSRDRYGALAGVCRTLILHSTARAGEVKPGNCNSDR